MGVVIGIAVLVAILVVWKLLENVVDRAVDEGIAGAEHLGRKVRKQASPGSSHYINTDDD